jgi:hypothetical protein
MGKDDKRAGKKGGNTPQKGNAQKGRGGVKKTKKVIYCNFCGARTGCTMMAA